MSQEVIETHQIRWWIWTLLLALAMSASQDMAIVIALIAIVLWALQRAATIQRYSLSMMVRLLLFIVTLRITFQMFFGVPVGNHVLFTLPEIDLFSGGLRVGGIFTLESLQTAFNEAVVLGGIIITLLASSMMVPSSSLLRRLPSGFSNVALVLSIALSFLPQLVSDVKRNIRANRWRGHSKRKISVIALNSINVIENALEKSIQISASMWRRGLGSDSANLQANSTRLFGVTLFFSALLAVILLTPHFSLFLLMMFGASLIISSFGPLKFQGTLKDILSNRLNLLIGLIGILVIGLWQSQNVIIEFTFIVVIALLSGRMLRHTEVIQDYVAY